MILTVPDPAAGPNGSSFLTCALRPAWVSVGGTLWSPGEAGWPLHLAAVTTRQTVNWLLTLSPDATGPKAAQPHRPKQSTWPCFTLRLVARVLPWPGSPEPQGPSSLPTAGSLAHGREPRDPVLHQPLGPLHPGENPRDLVPSLPLGPLHTDTQTHVESVLPLPEKACVSGSLQGYTGLLETKVCQQPS